MGWINFDSSEKFCEKNEDEIICVCINKLASHICFSHNNWIICNKIILVVAFLRTTNILAQPVSKQIVTEGYKWVDEYVDFSSQ